MSGDRKGLESLIPLGRGEQEFDTTYSDCVQYGRVQFWDSRYVENPDPFEWYYSYDMFRATINDALPNKESIIFYAGCGTSHLGTELILDGYKDVTIGDISRVAIQQQKIRNRDVSELKYWQGTMLDTNLPAKSYNCIIDKGLFDALLCTAVGSTSIKQYIYEVERLLKDEGVWIIISSSNPEGRLHMLEQYDIDEPGFTPWYIEVQCVLKPVEYEEEELDREDPESMYFIYICTKDEELTDKKMGKDTKKERKQREAKKKKAPLL